MARVFNGEPTLLSPLMRPVESVLYRAGGVDPRREQHWLTYTVAMLFFHFGGFLILYVLMRLQAVLPLNPADQSAVAQNLSLNTAVSFITNTNWQNYGGESTMSYLVQMVGLTHQNFLSAATGIALAMALIRCFFRASARTVGNFWVDITRCTLYILLPMCVRSVGNPRGGASALDSAGSDRQPRHDAYRSCPSTRAHRRPGLHC